MPKGIDEYLQIIAELNLVMPGIEESNRNISNIAKSFIEVFQENTVLLKQLQPTVNAFQKTIPAVHGCCRMFAKMLYSEYTSACYASGISPQSIHMREEISTAPLNWNASASTAYLTEEGYNKIISLSTTTKDEKDTTGKSIDSVIRIMDDNKDSLQHRDRQLVCDMIEKLHFAKNNLVHCADDLTYCFDSRANKLREYLDGTVPH